MKSPLTVLAESGVPLLIVGGTAVQVYGYSRFTKDFDCVIAREDDARLAAVLKVAGYEEFDRHNVVARYRHATRRDWIIDTLLLSADTFGKMWALRQTERLATIEMHVAAPQHVIAMKLHAVKQNPARTMSDVLDILELIKLQRARFSRDELAEICDRYGTPDLREKLLEVYDR